MRTQAREIVFKYIFSTLFVENDEELFAVLASDLNENDKTFAKQLLSSIQNNKEELLNKIESFSIGYKLNRLFTADKCALMIGMTELELFPDTDLPIIIDEAVKLCAKFSTEKSPDFVNGILAKYSKTLGR